MFELLRAQIVFQSLDNEIFDALLSLNGNLNGAYSVNIRRLKRFVIHYSKKFFGVLADPKKSDR